MTTGVPFVFGRVNGDIDLIERCTNGFRTEQRVDALVQKVLQLNRDNIIM